MRRAGFEVRVLPLEGMSWEENPPTLMEYIRRDLRWCQGNMQYWRLLGMPLLKPISRLQLAFAILMYIGSPAWMAMVAIGAFEIARAGMAGAPVGRVTQGAGSALLSIMLLMIFAPKLASCFDVLMRRSARRSYGGAAQFATNVASEILFSFLLSPIMALTHTGFMARLFLMRRGGAWNNQKRESHAVPWPLAWAKLWPHTLTGFALIGLVAATSPGEIGYALHGCRGPRVVGAVRRGHRRASGRDLAFAVRGRSDPGGNSAVGRSAVVARFKSRRRSRNPQAPIIAWSRVLKRD